MHTEQEEHRRERRKKILSWVVVILMTVSVLGAYFGQSDNSVRYKGVKYTPLSQGVSATIDGQRYLFNSFPASLEGIPTDPGMGATLKSPYLYVTYDSASNWSQTMAAVQYYYVQLFNGRFSTFVQPAVLDNTTFNLPLVSCANATAAQPVVFFREDNETSIRYQNNNCIVATAASNDDVLRVEDKLVLIRLGVFE